MQYEPRMNVKLGKTLGDPIFSLEGSDVLQLSSVRRGRWASEAREGFGNDFSFETHVETTRLLHR